MKCRYQYYGPKGEILWTHWFTTFDRADRPKKQPSNKLLIEYKDEEE